MPRSWRISRRRHEAVVREHHHMLAVVSGRIGSLRVDDDGREEAFELLESGVRVVPVGTSLDDGKFVDEGAMRRDARETDAGHTIHVHRRQQPVPVDGGFLVHSVLDRDPQMLTFPQSQQRPWHGAVDQHCRTPTAIDGPEPALDRQLQILTRQGCRCRNAGCGGRTPRRRQPSGGHSSTQNCRTAQEASSIHILTDPGHRDLAVLGNTFQRSPTPHAFS